MKWEGSAYVEAATRLNKIIAKHGYNVNYKIYEEESARLDSLLEDFRGAFKYK